MPRIMTPVVSCATRKTAMLFRGILEAGNFVLEHHATQFVRIRSRQEISEMVAKSTAKVVNGVLGATG